MGVGSGLVIKFACCQKQWHEMLKFTIDVIQEKNRREGIITRA